MASRGKSFASYGMYGSSKLSPTSAREKYAQTARKLTTKRAGMLIRFAFTITGVLVANSHKKMLSMLWYGKGNGVSATFAAWLKPRCPSEMTCTMRLRMGGEVLPMSPAGSYFCRAVRRRMIQDSTMATRARGDSSVPWISASNAARSSAEIPPSTGSFSDQQRLELSFALNPQTKLFEDVDRTHSPKPVRRGTGLSFKWAKSLSQRRCWKARACIRLKRCTTSSKKCAWSTPWFCFFSDSNDKNPASTKSATSDGCKNEPPSSALASNTMAMQAPSNHFEPIL
mmetsp:Transcript_60968/g.178273  ORF Transcript_60968/g.178273 Transcript_60968/m.178273 type:complete len:284 (+) Transcript_60968:280-1131(+)